MLKGHEVTGCQTVVLQTTWARVLHTVVLHTVARSNQRRALPSNRGGPVRHFCVPPLKTAAPECSRGACGQ